MPKCKLCGEMFGNHVKINGASHNMKNRRYCLKCSPFGRHNTKPISNPILVATAGNKFCRACKTEQPLENFYKRHGVCKSCKQDAQKKKIKEFKRRCVEYLGGKCLECGYHKCYMALDFHHRNPEEKDFKIAEAISKRFDDEIKRELDKCDLLCANCHRETHSE